MFQIWFGSAGLAQFMSLSCGVLNGLRNMQQKYLSNEIKTHEIPKSRCICQVADKLARRKRSL